MNPTRLAFCSRCWAFSISSFATRMHRPCSLLRGGIMLQLQAFLHPNPEPLLHMCVFSGYARALTELLSPSYSVLLESVLVQDRALSPNTFYSYDSPLDDSYMLLCCITFLYWTSVLSPKTVSLLWGCAEKGGCRVPHHKPSVTYPSSRSLHVFRRTKISGYVAKISLCYIPHVTGYVTGVGQGPCYKPIVLARAPMTALENFHKLPFCQ